MQVVFRVDASTFIGTGHVMRCLALAQAWRRTGGSAIFASAEIAAALEVRLRGEGFQTVGLSVTPGGVEDAAITVELARKQNASWIVADSYKFGMDYQRILKAAGLNLLFLDDYGHAGDYDADFILNQNLTADAALYARRSPRTRLLLGTRYVLLREEFLHGRDWKREIPSVARKVLVTLGGADPDNVTGKVIQALRGLDVEVKIVVGGSNPHLEQIRSQVSSLSPDSSSLALLTDVTNMPELMAWADVAIAAGGSTSWELAFMGLPGLVIVLADNQLEVAASLERAGVAVNLGEQKRLEITGVAEAVQALLANHPRRENMSRRGRQLVDGRGAQRVLMRMRATQLELRRARGEDCRLIWEWANDPELRAVSFSSEPIPWENHVRWYAGKSVHPACFFYVATNGCGQPIGQVRFELANHEAVISVSLAPSSRGKGYGTALIVRGIEQFFSESGADLIHAYIKTDNSTSVRAFEKADFKDAGLKTVGGHQARHFVFKKKSA
jgi:UDP-2,4-diacetamido-2,4,6-trideoxy-beta-L-altropyranose hydrolase